MLPSEKEAGGMAFQDDQVAVPSDQWKWCQERIWVSTCNKLSKTPGNHAFSMRFLLFLFLILVLKHKDKTRPTSSLFHWCLDALGLCQAPEGALRGRQKCNTEYMPEASGTIRLVWAPGKGEKFCQSETEHPFPWDMSYPDSPSINGMFPSGSRHRNVAPAKAQIPVSGCWELRRCSCLGRLVRSGDCLLMKGFKRFLMKVFL